MIKNVKRAEEFAGLIEVRFDWLSKSEFNPADHDNLKMATAWGRILNSTETPLISTFRPSEQGSERELSEEERREFWNSGYETDYCDVEEEFVEDTWYWLYFDRICSYHDFSGTPDDVPAIFERLNIAGAETAGA